mgnify:FL=1|jgi:hypothetical protein
MAEFVNESGRWRGSLNRNTSVEEVPVRPSTNESKSGLTESPSSEASPTT